MLSEDVADSDALHNPSGELHVKPGGGVTAASLTVIVSPTATWSGEAGAVKGVKLNAAADAVIAVATTQTAAQQPPLFGFLS